MKTAAAEARFEALLRDLCGRVPFLKLSSLKKDVKVPKKPGSRIHRLARITAGDRKWNLVVEETRSGQPREARMAVLQLESHLRHLPKDVPHYGVLLAPFISEESAKICAEAGIGYADLAGNARLSFDQVFIDTRAADNPFRVKRQLRSMFGAKAGRVLRVLLTPPMRAWKVAELAASAGVSFGQVSNVRKLLQDHEWAVADADGLRVIRPEDLARAWRKSYEPRPRAQESAYTLMHGEALESAVRAALHEAGQGAHAVLASYSAALWQAPYARQATRFFYADKKGTAILKRHLQLQPASQGANVVVMEPREDDVFSSRMEAAPGVWCTGLVQTWLDLNAAGERGEEAAEHLLKEKLLPAWKEVSR